MSRLGTTEKRENYWDVRGAFNGRRLTQARYNGTFDSVASVRTAMQAVDGVPTGFAISILKRATRLRQRAGVWGKSQPKSQR
jgi:hypothetical protein